MRHEFSTIVAIGAGGAIGAVSRYFISGEIMRAMGIPHFPVGTLFVNVLGAFVMGLIVEGVAVRWNLSGATQSFLTTGMLGGLTTFSTFSLETGLMFDRHAPVMAVGYAGASVILCVLALFFGMWVGRTVLI